MVYAIIVTYNGAKFIAPCLHSLLESTIPIKIVIIDNKSSDGTPEIIKNKFPDANLIELHQNIGFGKANNIGIRYAIDHGAEYVFLLNQDTRVDSSAIAELVKNAKNNPSYGILSPIHLNGTGERFDRRFLTYILDGADKLFVDIFRGKPSSIYPVNYVNAAAWLITKECLLNVGGFDPLFFMYGEDDDYARRVLNFNYKIGVVPTSIIYHYRQNETLLTHDNKRKMSMKQSCFRQRSSFMVILKNINRNLLRQILYLIYTFLNIFSKALLCGRPKEAFSSTAAFFLTVIQLPLIIKHRKISKNGGPCWL